jgi:hypothetical protein
MFDVRVRGFRVKFISLWFGLKVRLRYALIVLNKSSKLMLDQCFLNFILYMKHDNVMMYGAFMWN